MTAPAPAADDRARWTPLLPTAPIRFPGDFAWGVASSAFQAGFDPATGERREKASGDWLAEVIRDGVLDPAHIP